jgi:hypothetical protein
MKNPPAAPVAGELRERFDAVVARLAAVNDSLPVGAAMLWRRADGGGGPPRPGSYVADRSS